MYISLVELVRAAEDAGYDPDQVHPQAGIGCVILVDSSGNDIGSVQDGSVEFEPRGNYENEDDSELDEVVRSVKEI